MRIQIVEDDRALIDGIVLSPVVGIGLYLAREILRKEDGYIMIKSKKGEGAEFILHLLSNEI